MAILLEADLSFLIRDHFLEARLWSTRKGWGLRITSGPPKRSTRAA